VHFCTSVYPPSSHSSSQYRINSVTFDLSKNGAAASPGRAMGKRYTAIGVSGLVDVSVVSVAAEVFGTGNFVC